jgi:Tol biopolymer transport system component
MLPTAAAAQYFGKNRVQYRDFDFAIIETRHFDVYFYGGLREAATDAAQMAERAYARFSRVLHHQYRERQPIILFGSHSEFQQNNLTEIGEAVQGVTDPLRHRVLLPFTGSYQEFEHVLQHELVHQFQFDIFARGFIGAGIPQLLAVQPPLWFMEGMAEYLSVGPVNALTAMWLRDAALEGTLPTVQQLTSDPRVFPYRFGHALMAYIGERWGDDVIGEILHGVASSGVSFGFERALGMPLSQLSAEWHDAVQREYLPQIAERDKARAIGTPVLTRSRSDGGIHVSPSLSPDGTEIVYFSEGGSYFIDMYLADVETGRQTTRLVKSAFNAGFESLRFLNSSAAWSPDGKQLAFPAKRGGRDDLVIYDIERRRVIRRISIEIAGITSPNWSPDGRRLVFSGLDRGVSDLFVVNADGTGLERLTDDRYADLQPAWAPDGNRIAFATDRGPAADFHELRPAPLTVGIFDLATRRIELLPEMEGANINPQWGPGGNALAFVSDRTGTANVFLFDFSDRRVYQITDVFTGVSGITETSPAISWAVSADVLAFTYYENGEQNVYTMRRPATRAEEPYYTQAPNLVAAERRDPVDSSAAIFQDRPRDGDTFRIGRGFRSPGDGAETPAREPISVRALLDSAVMALPDTGDFAWKPYTPTLRIDYAIQPAVGYVRDNFGQGVYGGTLVSLSDMLGNRRALFGAQINGRIEEAQVIATYANLSSRTNWAVGYQQDPFFYFAGADITSAPETGEEVLSQRLERFIVHRAFAEAFRPFNRFHRLELRLSALNVSRAELNYVTRFQPTTGIINDFDIEKTGLGSANYLQPALALVYDNAVHAYVGPFLGRRTRIEYAPAVGDWTFHQGLVDYRRYDRLVGPVTLATRLFFFGRFGADGEQFPLFLGIPDLLRGYTAGSFRRRECDADAQAGARNCAELNQLIGTRVGLANAELRVPLTGSLGLLSMPLWFPPIEGAVFFDSGIAWTAGNTLTLDRAPDDDKNTVREPLSSWGVSLRGNLWGLMILRGDYAKPLSRSGHGAYWTLSIGPTF